MTHIAIIGTLVAAAWSVAAEEAPDDLVLQPPRITGQVQIDGVANEQQWTTAEHVEGFVDRTGAAVQASTDVRLFWNDEALLLAVRCEEPQTDTIRKTVTVDGSTVWEDDSIEVFIEPDARFDRSYLNVTITAAGVTRVQQVNRSFTGGMSWDAAARINDNSWVAELRLPWSLICGEAGDAPAAIKMSVCRTRWSQARESSAWDGGGWFHRPGAWVVLNPGELKQDALYRMVTDKERLIAGLSKHLGRQAGGMEDALTEQGDILEREWEQAAKRGITKYDVLDRLAKVSQGYHASSAKIVNEAKWNYIESFVSE